MTSSPPATGTSAIGRQSTSMPSDLRSAATRWIDWPVRGTQALHAPSLLIDQDWRFPPDGVAERLNQIGNLRRRTHVPLEDYEAPGPGLAEKCALTGGDGEPRQSRDERLCCHWRGLACARNNGQVLGC